MQLSSVNTLLSVNNPAYPQLPRTPFPYVYHTHVNATGYGRNDNWKFRPAHFAIVSMEMRLLGSAYDWRYSLNESLTGRPDLAEGVRGSTAAARVYLSGHALKDLMSFTTESRLSAFGVCLVLRPHGWLLNRIGHNIMFQSESRARIKIQLLISMALNVLQFLPGPVLIYVLTHSLSKEEYGIFSILLTSSLTLNHLFALGTSMYVFRASATEDRRQAATVLKSVFVVVAFASLLMLVLSWIALPTVLQQFNLGAYQPEYALILVISALTAWFFTGNFYLYGLKRINLYNFTLFIRNNGWRYILIFMFIINTPVKLIHVPITMLINLALASMLVLTQLDIASVISAPISKTTARASVRYGVPLIPYYSSTWGILSIAQYVLAYFGPVNEVAYLALNLTLFNFVVMLAVSITQVLNPYIFEAWRNSEKQNSASDTQPLLFEYSIKYTSLMYLLLTVVIVAFAPEVIELIAGQQYLDALMLLPAFVIFCFFRTLLTVFEQRLLASGETAFLSGGYIIADLTVLMLGALLTHFWGAVGMSISLVIAYLVLAILVGRRVSRNLTIQWQFLRWPAWLFWIFATLGAEWVAREVSGSVIVVGLVVLGSLCIPAIVWPKHYFSSGELEQISASFRSLPLLRQWKFFRGV